MGIIIPIFALVLLLPLLAASAPDEAYDMVSNVVDLNTNIKLYRDGDAMEPERPVYEGLTTLSSFECSNFNLPGQKSISGKSYRIP